MDELDSFIVEEGRGIYRPVGSVSFSEAAALVRVAITTRRHRQQCENGYREQRLGQLVHRRILPGHPCDHHR